MPATLNRWTFSPTERDMASGMLLASLFAVIVLALLADATALPATVTYEAFKSALVQVQMQNNSGLHFPMWGTIVDRDGVVQMVVFSGANRHTAFPGSRMVSASKANSANAFSIQSFSISTANLYGEQSKPQTDSARLS